MLCITENEFTKLLCSEEDEFNDLQVISKC